MNCSGCRHDYVLYVDMIALVIWFSLLCTMSITSSVRNYSILSESCWFELQWFDIGTLQTLAKDKTMLL